MSEEEAVLSEEEVVLSEEEAICLRRRLYCLRRHCFLAPDQHFLPCMPEVAHLQRSSGKLSEWADTSLPTQG